jgi:hypothetical protein
MFRLSHRGEGIDDAESIEGARLIVGGLHRRALAGPILLRGRFFILVDRRTHGLY